MPDQVLSTTSCSLTSFLNQVKVVDSIALGDQHTGMLVIWRDGSLFIEGVSKSQIDAPYLVWWRKPFVIPLRQLRLTES